MTEENCYLKEKNGKNSICFPSKSPRFYLYKAKACNMGVFVFTFYHKIKHTLPLFDIFKSRRHNKRFVLFRFLAAGNIHLRALSKDQLFGVKLVNILNWD